MKIGRLFLPLLISLLLVLAVFIQMLKFQDANGKMQRVVYEIDRLDRIITEDEKALQALRENYTRLSRLADDTVNCYLPVLIEGKELHVTLTDSQLDDISASLALKDLLMKYHAGKGAFQSGDSLVWKKRLVQAGIKEKSRLRDVEIPSVQKRIAEVEEERAALQTERNKVFAEYQALQQRPEGVPR